MVVQCSRQRQNCHHYHHRSIILIKICKGSRSAPKEKTFLLKKVEPLCEHFHHHQRHHQHNHCHHHRPIRSHYDHIILQIKLLYTVNRPTRTQLGHLLTSDWLMIKLTMVRMLWMVLRSGCLYKF